MTDVPVDLEIENPVELVNQGIKAFNVADFNSAVIALSRAVELLAVEHGDQHDSLGNAYFYYGKSLLEVYREEVQPLGDAVPREIDSDSDEDDPDENVATEETKAEETVANDVTSAADAKENTAKSSDIEVTGGTLTNGEATSSDANNTPCNEEPAEEEASDLQVAWEVLELAKMIFDARGVAGIKELAETFVLLGEVSLESENFASAIDDIKRGLEIQKEIFEDDSRTLAQTYYKLAVALSTNNQIDEAVEHFNTSLDILKKRINNLKKNEDANEAEIKDIEGLIPEIDEKVADMKSFKEETANRLVAALQEKTEAKGPFDPVTSGTTASDISHLIKRKRKPDEDDTNNKPAKKA